MSTATTELATLNTTARGDHFTPGWDRQGNPPMWSEPKTSFVPYLWKSADAYRYLNESREVVPLELTERRNLILTNPAPGNIYPSVRTLVMAYQMVVPGDIARTHRHAPHAGRVILESEGAFTVVNGVRIDMKPGDILLTPGMHWHGHGHEGTEPAIWVDFLDIPLVQLLEPMYFEPYDDETEFQMWETITRDSPFVFPIEKTHGRLASAEIESPFHGRRIKFDTDLMPTIGLYAVQLRPGESTEKFRTTSNHQFVVIEGSGVAEIDGQEIPFERGDAFVAPAWKFRSLRSDDGAILVNISDEPLQQYCKYFREESAAEAHEDTRNKAYRVGA
ncbi:cupin domain-containing protein [Microbacterium sp. NPDC077663]|uniref:cupin domain-containing protein n=1 Tax=Microbacterium sp. NPDC077663 TaxID=3364189 RepID=UPI0037C72207